MKNVASVRASRRLVVAVVLAICLTVFPASLSAQGTQGQDAVYNSSNGVVGSSSFIDARQFLIANEGVDLCDTIYYIFTHNYPSGGAVVDARGISGSALTCMLGSPWTEGSTTVTVPSTILLPATGATPIIIPKMWVLPPQTHLIGEGDGIPIYSNGTLVSSPGTTIQALTTFTDSSMIQFIPTGTSCSPPSQGAPSPCTGISVERLTLDGNGDSINGITNALANEQSYVNHVGLYRIRGTGLAVSGTASHSGPYSNIAFDLGGLSGTTSTVCASINGAGGLTGTRGIHGLSCTSESTSNDPPAAVLLDASNNSIEDVRIVGFYDGVLVGANATAQSDVLINIIGDTTTPVTPINTVHISSQHTVTDLSIMGLSNSGVSGTYTLQDDVTDTHLSDPTVGIYALGESPSGGVGYSRFSTSPHVASWAVGTAAPSGNCSQGSLYSCVNTQANCTLNLVYAALWVCGPKGWTTVK